MSTLLLDIGNSRVKWALLDERRLGEMHVVPNRGTGWARRVLTAARVAARSRGDELLHVAAVNVGGPVAARVLRAATRVARLPAPRFAASAARAAGVTNAYREPWRLGVDRWVALVGARQLARRGRVPRAVCVIDAGTALTIDLLDARGVHRGGLIAPGAQLMVDSLLQGTRGIRRRAAGAATPALPQLFSRDTRSGLAAGAVYGNAALIDRAVTTAREQLGATPLVVLAGGGAPSLQPLLRSRPQLLPDLVLRGLAVLVAARLC